MKLDERLERLVSSAVGLKLANAKDYKEFVPTAAQAILTDLLGLVPEGVYRNGVMLISRDELEQRIRVYCEQA